MLLALLLIAAPMKISVSPLASGEGVTDKTAATLTQALVAQMRSANVGSVITHDEMQSLLSLEEQKQMVGCSSSACIAELGGALGVDHMVQGNVGKLGESFFIYVKLFNVKQSKVERGANRTVKGHSADVLLPELAPMVRELFGAAAAPVAKVAEPVAQPTTPSKAVSAQDIPEPNPPKTLSYFTDNKGHFAAYDLDSKRFFYGTDKAMYEQRTEGSSRNVDIYRTSFWEPQYRDGVERYFEMEGDRGGLTCGKTEVVLAKTKAPTGVKFFKVRWQRKVVFMGQTDTGTYVFVDESLNDGDFRLFVGKRGAMGAPFEAESVDGHTFTTDQGALVWDPQHKTATWQGAKLSPIDMFGQAAFVYNKLGVYQGQRRATPCESPH